MSIRLYEQARFVDRSIEQAEAALQNPMVADLLGARTQELAERLGRLVPVLSTEDGERMASLDDPDALPFLVPSNGETIYVDRGTAQYSSLQQQAVRSVLTTWRPSRRTVTEILSDHSGMAEGSALARLSSDLSPSTEAAAFAPATASSVLQMSEMFGLETPPPKRLVRVSMRPAVKAKVRDGHQYVAPELLLHELTHVVQKEVEPVKLFSSQADVDDAAMLSELEAYHIGAQVKLGLEGLTRIEDATPELLHNIQLAVEAVRARHNSDAEPFKPTRRIVDALLRSGFNKERMFSYLFNYEDVMSQLGVTRQAPVKKLPPKANKSGGRTTSKK